MDLSKRLSQRALRQRRLAAEDEKVGFFGDTASRLGPANFSLSIIPQLRRQKRQEEEARQAQIAQRLAEEKRQKALEEARRRTEEEAERRRMYRGWSPTLYPGLTLSVALQTRAATQRARGEN